MLTTAIAIHRCGNGEGSFELMWVNAQVDTWANERQECSGCSRHDWTGTWTGREWATGRGENESERMCIRKSILAYEVTD